MALLYLVRLIDRSISSSAASAPPPKLLCEVRFMSPNPTSHPPSQAHIPARPAASAVVPLQGQLFSRASCRQVPGPDPHVSALEAGSGLSIFPLLQPSKSTIDATNAIGRFSALGLPGFEVVVVVLVEG